MKFIIYWCFYTSSLGGGEMSGTIGITDSTVYSYIYDVGYVEWQIVEKRETFERNRLEYAEYRLKAGSLLSLMKITNKNVYHYIMNSPPIHIEMKRKLKFKQNGKENRIYESDR